MYKFCYTPSNDISTSESTFENNISVLEVIKAVEKSKRNKAPGFDNIPYEVYKNDIAISFLHILFNVCYQSGKTPSDWGKGVLNPIPKPGVACLRQPLNYRGINPSSTMYKLYCSILNERLSMWLDENEKIVVNKMAFERSVVRLIIYHLFILSLNHV
jgi:hypothetical protein